MKKTFFLFFSLCFLFGVSYGQGKLSPELVKATETAPSQGKISIIITMAEQYDGAGLDTRTAYMSRRDRTQLVVEELQSLAQRSQADLRSLLEEAHDQVTDLQAYWIFNGFSCKATPEMIHIIAQRPDVSHVDIDAEYRAPINDDHTETPPDDRSYIQWNVSHIQADDVWTYNGETGYTGAGVVVAVLDSGVNYNHNDLKNNMWNGGSTFPYHGYDFANSDKNPIEGSSSTGTGTMVAGIIAGHGTSRTTGVAPGAQIMAIQTVKIVSGTLLINESWINQGLQWAMDPTHRADVIVVSTIIEGASGSAANRIIMNNILRAGIAVFTGAGNLGEDPSVAVPNKVGMPANCPSPWHNSAQTTYPGETGKSANICVGAIYQNNYKAGFSSIGPVTWANVADFNDYPYTPGNNNEIGLIRPDVVAPGVNITSTSHKSNDGYLSSGKGTAMSAAHAAGVAALLLEADSTLTPAKIDSLLETTAHKCEGMAEKNNFYGAGLINAYDAITALLSPLQAPSDLTVSANDNNVTLQWTGVADTVSYNVYCNEEEVATGVTNTTYTYQTDFSGRHTYYVRAVDTVGNLSPKSNYASIFINPEGPIVTNLHATVNNSQHKVALTWELPNQTNTMRYGSAESADIAYPGQNGKPTFWAQRYPSSKLVDYAGTVIDTISIYFNEYKNTTYTLRVYDGNANGPDQKLSENQFTVASNEINAWKKVALSNPVAIDHTKDLWIVMIDPKNAYPTNNPPGYTANATYCLLPENDPTGFPALKSTDGNSWSAADNKWAWMIKAHLTTGTYTYNVQCDQQTIVTNRTALNYTHTNVTDGVHYYTVTTNYNNGQSTSFPCTPVRANMNTHFTVTFDAGEGSCPVETLTQGNDGTVTLPDVDPSTLCASEGYTFAGWCTQIVEGTYTQPELLQAGTHYSPDDDMTLYAVYQNVEGEYGWKQARSLQTGDRICLVSQDHGVEMDGISLNVATTVAFDTDPKGRHAFTAQAQGQGFRLKDDEGKYLCNNSGWVTLSNSLNSGCIWTVEFIDGNAYLRNSDGETTYQLMAQDNGGTIVIAALDRDYLEDNASPIQLYRLKGNEAIHYAYDPGCGTVVKDPTFSPEADGVYLNSISVSLSCNTQGATIRYTTNNTEPTANSTVYSNAISVNGVVTIKAKAFKDGMEPSATVSQTYQFPVSYSNIAEFKDADNPDDIARINSTMTVTYHQGRYLYVSDDTGGLLVFDDYDQITETFEEGDQITLLTGRYRLDNEQPMLIPLTPVTKTGMGEAPDPISVSVEELLSDYYPMDAQLVQIEDVVFHRSYDSNGDEELDTLGFVQDGNEMALRNVFENLDGDIDNIYHYDITGLLGIQGSTILIYPRNMDDIRQYHLITLEPTEHGTLEANAEQASHLSTVTLTALPDSLYHLEQLYYYTTNPNNHVNIDMEEGTFEMPDENVTVVAVFAEDVCYTVTFDPGNGHCDTPSLQESAWNAGVTLPTANPSNACASQGYTFVGWAEEFIEESMAQPELFAAGSTYHPTSDLTLYAVYTAPSGADWQEVTTTQQLIEGDYIVATLGKETNRYFYLRREGVVNINPTARKILQPITPPQDAEAPSHLWTIAKINSTEYSISYTDNGITYYLESFNTSAQNNRVTTTKPTRGWTFTNHSQYGLLIQFPSVTTERYLDLKDQGLNSKWYSHIASALEGQIHLFRSPSNLYSTNPECAEAVATPEFVGVPEGLILTDNYMVTLTCATEGATIYYTTDGSTPNNNSAVYSAPFAITESCTVKAIAYNGDGESSEVASQAFSFPTQFPNIAAFKQAGNSGQLNNSTIARIAGDVQFVFRHGQDLYLCDESAGLLVHDNSGVVTNTYAEGDVISGGIVGTYMKSGQQPMMIPTANPAAGVADTPVAPMVATADQIKNDYDTYDARLVTVLDAAFPNGYDFATNTVALANDGTDISVKNQFGTLTCSGAAGEHDDVTGLVGIFAASGTYKKGLYPRANSDFVRYYGITCVPVEHGSISATPDHARAGDEVTLHYTTDPGYAFGQWTVTGPNGSNVTVTGDHFTMPAGEVTVSATLTQIDYTIIITAIPGTGGTVTEGGTFHYGDVIQLTATPNYGYKFHHWEIGGSSYTNNPRPYTVKGDDDIIAVFHETTDQYLIELVADGNGTVEGGGSFLSGTPVTVTATADEGSTFVNWTENGEVVSTEAGYSFTVTGNRTLTAHFSQGGGEAEQPMAITEGWNWWSTYLEADDALFTGLKGAIAENNTSAMIKSANNSIMLQGGTWTENPNNPLTLDNASMYMLNIENAVTATLNGQLAAPAEHEITLLPGWNWIGFVSATPMSIEDAFAGITPNNGDMVKSSGATASYTNHWNNAFAQEPGKGYMYYNCGTEALTLVYPATAKAYVRSMPVELHWNTDPHRHATNLSVMATLDASQYAMGEGNYEIGAFCGEECRGSARLQLADGQYMTFMVVNGEPGETIRFKLYDVANGRELGLSEETLTYEPNAIVGSVPEPEVLHFRGTTGVDELAYRLNVYPNPSDEWILIEAEGLQSATLFSLTGQVVLHEEIHSETTRLNVSHLTPGLYLLQAVRHDGNVVNRKVEIK